MTAFDIICLLLGAVLALCVELAAEHLKRIADAKKSVCFWL